MSVFENSRAVINQTMCNDFNFDALGNPKLSMNGAKIPLSQQNTIDRRSATYKVAFKNIDKIQIKLERNLNTIVDIQTPMVSDIIVINTEPKLQ